MVVAVLFEVDSRAVRCIRIVLNDQHLQAQVFGVECRSVRLSDLERVLVSSIVECRVAL